MSVAQIAAFDITQALERRHADDVFFSEVKDGATLTRNHLRLDGWALLRSWSPVDTIGYEIKVSRSDWLADAKVERYLPLCHRLVICAPKGVVLPQEVPAGVGLQHALVSKDGRVRLATAVKAERRAIEMPVHLLLYLLMSRTQPMLERGVPWTAERVQHELERGAAELQAGRSLSTQISKALNLERLKTQENASKARAYDDLCQAIHSKAAERGIPAQYYARYALEQIARQPGKGEMLLALKELDRVAATLERARSALQKATQEPKQTP